MSQEYYESDEESEYRFEEELKRLENAPSWEGASYEKFSAHPSDIGAKYLWLKFTLSGDDVPRDVMARMISIIKDDIERYEDGRLPPGALSTQEVMEPYFELLHYAKEDPDHFWQILHDSSGNVFSLLHYPDSLLSAAREKFPFERKLKPGELYEFFGEQIGIEKNEKGSDVGEKIRLRYRNYKNNLKLRSDDCLAGK